MQKQSESTRWRRGRQVETSTSNADGVRLAQLAQDFLALRAAQGRCKRVPDTLRSAVLEALGAGESMRTLRRVCGVTRGQVEDWQKSRRRRLKARREPAQVRTFAVVDQRPDAPTDAAPEPEPKPEPASEQTLELHVGAWSVSVRLSECGGCASQARGSTCCR